MRKKIIIFIVAASSSLVALILIVYGDLTSTECYDISRDRAEVMIGNILEEKKMRSEDGLVLFGLRASQIMPQDFRKDLSRKGDGWSTVEIIYVETESGVPVLSARIYENCDIEWLNLRDS